MVFTRGSAASFTVTALVIALCCTGTHAFESNDALWGSGDKIRITVFERPSISGIYTIRAPGVLSVPVVGEISVVDRTTREIEADITARLGLKNGQNDHWVSVEASEYRPVFVTGLIDKPGRYPYFPGMTVLHMIASAGGIARIRLGTEDENRRFEEAYAHARVSLATALADYAALRAEYDGAESVAMPDELSRHVAEPLASRLATMATARFEQRRALLESENEALEKAKTELGQELHAYRGQLDSKDTEARLVAEEIALLEKSKNAVVPATFINSLRRIAAGIEGDRRQLAALISRTRSEIRKEERDHERGIAERRLAVAAELRDLEETITKLRISLRGFSRRQAASRLPGNTDAETEPPQLTLIRTSSSGVVRTLPATELTPVRPGDLLTVSAE